MPASSKRQRQPLPRSRSSVFPHAAPVRPDPPLPPASAHVWERPQLPSDLDLLFVLYRIHIANYWFAHGDWPRFAAPGCACGEAVVTL